MPRKPLAVAIACCFCSLGAHALEWDDAYYSGSMGSYFALQKSSQPYPTTAGISLAGAYHLPLFVEGHSKAVIRSQYGWYQPRPETEEGKRGASNHSLAAQILLMHDLHFHGRTIWWGAGLNRQVTYVTNHYEWNIDQGKWAFEVFEDGWEFSSAVLLMSEINFSKQLGIAPKMEINLFNNQPQLLGLEIWFRF